MPRDSIEPVRVPRLPPASAEDVFGTVRSEPVEVPRIPPASPEDVFGTVSSDPIDAMSVEPASPEDVWGPAVRADLTPRLYLQTAEEMLYEGPRSILDEVRAERDLDRALEPPTIYDMFGTRHSTRG